MGNTTTLPEGFEALVPFVDAWSIEGAANRAQRRLDSTAAEREAFFEAASGLAAPALERLDRKPLGELDDSERRLLNLMLSLTHVSLAVEVQRDHEEAHARGARQVRITRAPSDGST